MGSDATVTLPLVWEDMRAVRAHLLKLGYQNPQVCVVGRRPVHFHTKLFRFLKTTQPSWFIGSANPGSDRHELMMTLVGRHKGLSQYVEAVFDGALSVTERPPQREPPGFLSRRRALSQAARTAAFRIRRL